MSQVKDQNHNAGRMVYPSSTRGEGLSSGDSPRGRVGGNGDASVSEASIAVGRHSAESAMDDGGEDEDVDSPRNRGRAYDDRWKVRERSGGVGVCTLVEASSFFFFAEVSEDREVGGGWWVSNDGWYDRCLGTGNDH